MWKGRHAADGESTFLVTTASADRSAMDSSRGFASKLSPTQTASNAPESSPRFAISKSSGTVTAPMITPRLASVSPNVPMIESLPPRFYSIRSRDAKP